MTRAEAEEAVRAIPRRCRGPITPEAAQVRDALLADGNLEDARAEDNAGRPGCGADFNEIVCSVPFDGARHEYTCPSCGVEGTFTAPIFDLEEAA